MELSKKIYAQLNEAHTRAIAIYGPFENRFPAEVGYRHQEVGNVITVLLFIQIESQNF